MTRVLLIADTDRVQRIFLALEEKGVLQLQTASTLALGEFEISSSPPDFTFVQSRISGFSGDILLRHLDKMLPQGAKLVFLAGDAEDAAQARRQGKPSLDLSLGDEVLEQSVIALLTGKRMPAKSAADGAPPAKPAAAKSKPLQPAQESEPTAAPAVEETPPPAAQPFEFPELTPGAPAQPTPTPSAPESKPAGVRSIFDDLIQRSSAGLEARPVQEVEDRVELGKGRPSRQEAGGTEGELLRGRSGDLVGEPLAEAMRRAEMKSKKSGGRYLLIFLVLALIAVPLVSYLVGKRSSSEPEQLPVAEPAQKQAEGFALFSTPPPAALPEAKRATAPAVQGGAATPQAQPGTQPGKGAPAKPAEQPPAPPKVQAKSGLPQLPPMLEGTKFDAAYGKSHPGWERYVGLRAEYKLFKENGVYRAMQVFAGSGGAISEEHFNRVLREFGGIDSYKVQSSKQKGDYLIEQGAGPGPAALTIYRNKDNHKIKALVVYYR